MKIVFFGSDNFALNSLELLAKKGIDIASVVTVPDKKKGRGMKVSPLKIKELALELGIDVYQPEKLNVEAISHIRSFNPELIVVVAYGKILPKEILDLPPKGCINLHASLLPKLRGAGAIAYSIIHGYEYTGVTTMYVNEKMDSGDIVYQKKVKIEPVDTTATLSEKLAKEGAGLLYATLKDMQSGKIPSIPQDDSKATYAPKLKKKDGLINWDKSAEEIFNLIRGASPWPSAYTFLNGKMFKIHKAEHVKASEKQASPGEIVNADEDGLVVATGKGNLKILEVQLEGKRKMPVGEFLRGYKLNKDIRF
jgi:methionyl-tRNA formyltransferase